MSWNPTTRILLNSIFYSGMPHSLFGCLTLSRIHFHRRSCVTNPNVDFHCIWKNTIFPSSVRNSYISADTPRIFPGRTMNKCNFSPCHAPFQIELLFCHIPSNISVLLQTKTNIEISEICGVCLFSNATVIIMLALMYTHLGRIRQVNNQLITIFF